MYQRGVENITEFQILLVEFAALSKKKEDSSDNYRVQVAVKPEHESGGRPWNNNKSDRQANYRQKPGWRQTRTMSSAQEKAQKYQTNRYTSLRSMPSPGLAVHRDLHILSTRQQQTQKTN